MCIIVVKPADVTLPSNEIFKNCFDNNDDGAGMMIAYNGKVYGSKGLMTYEGFNRQLESYKNTYGDLKSYAMVFHFRIGTHGTNIPENTHPFPLDDYKSYGAFKQTEWVADQGFAHNGILYQFGTHADVKKYDVSDTMVFGRRVAAILANSFNIATDPEAQFILDKMPIGSSKFVYLDGNGNIATFGTFIPDNGILYSNSSYKNTPRHSYVYNYDYSGSVPWWGNKYLGENGSTYSSNISSQANTNKGTKGSSKASNASKAPKVTMEEAKYRKGRADELGLTMITSEVEVMCDDTQSDIDGSILEAFMFAYSYFDIYYWSEKENDWALYEQPYGGFALYDRKKDLFVYDGLLYGDYDVNDYDEGFYYQQETYDETKRDKEDGR